MVSGQCSTGDQAVCAQLTAPHWVGVAAIEEPAANPTGWGHSDIILLLKEPGFGQEANPSCKLSPVLVVI